MQSTALTGVKIRVGQMRLWYRNTEISSPVIDHILALVGMNTAQDVCMSCYNVHFLDKAELTLV